MKDQLIKMKKTLEELTSQLLEQADIHGVSEDKLKVFKKKIASLNLKNNDVNKK